MKEINDCYGMNAKGHVKIEKIDENGNVIDTIENHNVVVNDATDLVAAALADPSGYTEVAKTFQEEIDIVADDLGRHFLENPLPYGKCTLRTAVIQMSEVNSNVPEGAGQAEVVLPEGFRPVYDIKSLKLVKDDEEMHLNPTVNTFVKDEEEGVIVFVDDITKEDYDQVEMEVYRIENRSTAIIPGSEEVHLTSQHHLSSNTYDQLVPDIRKADEDLYGIDYNTGEVWFHDDYGGDGNKGGTATIKYKYKVINGINFMGIGDAISSHPRGYPVVLTDDHKDLTGLRNEHEGARQPLIFPAKITRGSTDTVARQADGETEKFKTPANHTPLLEIVDVTVYTEEGVPISYEPVDEFTGVSDGTDEDYYEVKIADEGKGSGNNGILKFNPAPPAADMRNVRIDYRWDSGATVNFVAEFSPEVPQARLRTTQEAFTADQGQTDYYLEHDAMEILSVYKDGNEEISLDLVELDESVGNKVVLDIGPEDGTPITIEYRYEQRNFDIYEVGLFNGPHEDALMFSISGIGPITKDENTGMRITWSITF